MTEPFIYFDNAATTYPKPKTVLEKMVSEYGRLGVSPGRGSYDLAQQVEIVVQDVRRDLARFFNAPDPDRIVFTANATDALNTVLQGLVNPGDHVVSTRLEHNSVLRPLHHLKQLNQIAYDLVPFDGQGFIDPEDVRRAIRTDTKAVILCHASNVLGTVQPVKAVGRICSDHGIPLILDTAQSAGIIPIDMTGWLVSAVVFTGHKSMFGPTGIGGLILAPDLDVRTTRYGGTGIDSGSLVHTQTYPHCLEAGTLNVMGIMGLSAGIAFLEEQGLQTIHQKEMRLLTRFRDALSGNEKIKIYCADDLADHVGLATLNVSGIDPEDVGAILDGDFGIAVRVGLHCAPLIHETLGTLPRGGVRFSLGPFNTREDIDAAVSALTAIARSDK